MWVWTYFCGTFVSGKYKSHFRYFALQASKIDRGRGVQQERSRMVHTSPFSFFIFFFFLFFLSIFISILFSSLYFSFYFVIVFQNIIIIHFSTICVCFCCLFMYLQSLFGYVGFVLSAFICVLSRSNCFLV